MAVRSQAMSSTPAASPGKGWLAGLFARNASSGRTPAAHRVAVAAPAHAPGKTAVISRSMIEDTTPLAEKLFAWFVLLASFIATGVWLDTGNWQTVLPTWAGGTGFHVGPRFWAGIVLQAAATYIEWGYGAKRPWLYWSVLIFMDVIPSALGVHAVVGYFVEKMFSRFIRDAVIYVIIGWVATAVVAYKMARYPEKTLVGEVVLVATP